MDNIIIDRKALSNKELRIFFKGEINVYSAKELVQAITLEINTGKPITCVLDFKNVTFVDESVVKVIMNAKRSMTHIGGNLVLSQLSKQAKNVLHASGIDMLVAIE